ncbi:MAG: UbiD family decarboxylase [Planctomycetes bacterium]|nr:UbiD family decarboxylase [Planctomycetota bacterium]
MSDDTLTTFLNAVEDDGELVRVRVEVDPRFELAEIVARSYAGTGDGPALFFENVAGRSMPVVANLLGSRRRLLKALGVESLEAAGDKLASLTRAEIPDGWTQALRLVPQWTQLARLPPRSIKTGVCQQVVRMGQDVNLGELPIPHCWPGEAAAAITLGQVVTADPDEGLRSVELAPLSVRGRNTLAVHWTAHDGGWANFESHRRRRRQMPVSVVVGGDPILAFAAEAPLPPRTDPWLLAGLLRGRSVETVRCRSVELEVPAGAELVIEGLVDTTQPVEPAGPTALPTGFLSLETPAPTLSVTAITHRSNPVFPIRVYAQPPSETTWIARACERMFLPLVRLAVPEVVDLHLPPAGAGRNLAFVSIRKRYAGQARKVLNALWGLERLATMKLLVVVDAEVDVHNEGAVWFHVGAHAHPGRDAVFCEGPTHAFDHAAPVCGMGHKLGLDATRKLPEEGHPRPWPAALDASEEIRRLVTRRWSEYGLKPQDPAGADAS